MLRGMFVPPALSQTRFPHLSRAGKEFRTCFLGPKIALSTRDVLPRRLVALLHGPLRGPPTARKVPRGMFVLPALLQTRLPPLFRAGKGLSHMLPWSNMSETITRPLQSGLFTALRQRGRRLWGPLHDPWPRLLHLRATIIELRTDCNRGKIMMYPPTPTQVEVLSFCLCKRNF